MTPPRDTHIVVIMGVMWQVPKESVNILTPCACEYDTNSFTNEFFANQVMRSVSQPLVYSAQFHANQELQR